LSRYCPVEFAECVGIGYSILGSEALWREFRDGILAERKGIETAE
jgi:hypothetical protein